MHGYNQSIDQPTTGRNQFDIYRDDIALEASIAVLDLKVIQCHYGKKKPAYDQIDGFAIPCGGQWWFTQKRTSHDSEYLPRPTSQDAKGQRACT
jgi:hypothetical protein